MTVHTDLKRLAALVAANRPDVVKAADGARLPRWLYERWYLAPEEGLPPDTIASPYDSLGAALSAVADMAVDWETDWIALSVTEDGSCLAGRKAEQRVAQPGRYVGFDRPGLPTVPGERLALPCLLSWVDAATGQWAAQSNVPPDGRRIRLYVNVGSDAVGEAVAALTRWLAREKIAFSMKCPGIAAGFARTDALVLYLSELKTPNRESEVIACLKPLAHKLRAGRPALTRALMPGVAFADDPGNGMSFGEHRCDILASAVSASLTQNLDLVGALVAALRNARVDPEQPWRQPL